MGSRCWGSWLTRHWVPAVSAHLSRCRRAARVGSELGSRLSTWFWNCPVKIPYTEVQSCLVYCSGHWESSSHLSSSCERTFQLRLQRSLPSLMYCLDRRCTASLVTHITLWEYEPLTWSFHVEDTSLVPVLYSSDLCFSSSLESFKYIVVCGGR